LVSALPELQAALQRWTGGQLVDLHVSDLANAHLTSHFDYTSWYDVLVFRRLAAAVRAETAGELAAAPKQTIDSRPRAPCSCTSPLSNRTNAIMRTLTVLTAIFLPLNLMTGIFGMNFDALPLIHTAVGVWVAFGIMAIVGTGLGLFFWRKRYLGTHHRP
jgi:Mg2+ and Co2+ transporter CorA